MKKNSLLLAVVICLAAASTGLAADKADKDKETKQTKAAASEVKKAKAQPQRAEIKTEITGSHLKQTIRRNGMITDGASQVVVLDRDAIAVSGANSVTQLLNRYGVH